MKKTGAFLTASAILISALLSASSFAEPIADNSSAAIDRAVVLQTLYEREGRPDTGGDYPFADAEGTWYYTASAWGSYAGIILGDGEGNLHGDRPITYAELVSMLYRYAQYKGYDVSVGEDTNILSYDDAFEIPGWSMAAFQWACGAGVMPETGSSLNYDKTVTRSAFAEILSRFTNETALSLWTDDAESKNELVSYVKAVTDETSPDYIPVEDRIAVFDFDGTLFCETDPNYFDYCLLKYRVLDDPDYKDKASDFEREVALKIKDQNENGTSYSGLEVDHGKAVASAFSGMTLDEFNSYIQQFKAQEMPSYDGMTRGGGFYKPMVEVVEYLQKNDFTVYIVSGTDRLIVRGIMYENVLDIPNSQIIGSDEIIVASNQGETDGLNYVFTDSDELILGGEFIIKNLKMNKVSVIMQEIGQQPVLSFGNSTGDASMAEYVITGNKYKSLAFMLCCDDTVRENGNEGKADKMYALCDEFGWIPVSMKNDWVTIYGDMVVKH